VSNLTQNNLSKKICLKKVFDLSNARQVKAALWKEVWLGDEPENGKIFILLKNDLAY